MKPNLTMLIAALSSMSGLVALAQPPASTPPEKVWRDSQEIYLKVDRDEFPKIIHADFSDEVRPNTYVIRNAANLRTLVVGGPRCTDDSILPDIEKAKSLRTLILDSTNITEEGITQFKQRRPEVLVLRSQRWAIEQIAELSPEMRIEKRLNDDYPELRKLLGDALFQQAIRVDTGRLVSEFERWVHPFTDAQMMPIKFLNTLTYLDLSHSEITDAGLQYVKECKQLEHLTLPVGLTSDRELIQCAKELRKLKTLELRFPTYVGYPDAAYQRYKLLQEQLPGVAVTSYTLQKLVENKSEEAE
jgi:hypothetical protein